MNDDDLFDDRPPPPQEPVPEPATEPETLYPTSDEWVERWLMRWTTAPDRWCVEWTDHPVAQVRIHALWMAWEAAHIDADPAAMSSWWLLHHDGHMAVLGSAKGPFARCKSAHSPDVESGWERNH